MAVQDHTEGLDFFPDDLFIDLGGEPQASDLFLGRVISELRTLVPEVGLGSGDKTARAPADILPGVRQILRYYPYMDSSSI